MTARNGMGTVVVPLQELLEAMTDGVLITDENGRCTYSNPALDHMVGTKACDPALTDDAPGWISLPNQSEYRRLITRSLNGRIPRIDDGDIPGNIRACAEIVKTGATVFVPGHGQSGDRALVDAMRTYFDTVYSSVEKLYEDGLSDFEMKDDISAQLQAFADWEDFDAQLGKHISFSSGPSRSRSLRATPSRSSYN